MNENIPIKITPDPIINAVIEIRFNTDIPENAVFGAIYNKLSNNYPIYKNLGIPFEISHIVPQLKHSAEAEISNEDYVIGIGSNVVLFKIQGDYKGWDVFYSIFKRDFEFLLQSENLIKDVERIGLRYINIFKNENDIFNSFDLDIKFGNKENYKVKNTSYTTTLIDNDISLTLRIADQVKSSKAEEGLLLDIDAYKTDELKKNKIMETINSLHEAEKKLFFRLLKIDFLNKFNPVYEE